MQSTALLVLAAQRRIPYELFLFANVGDDSEHPASLEYVETYAKPYAAAHEIELVELRRIPKRGFAKGREETLYQRLVRPESRSVPIPVRMTNGAPGRRSCTADYKIRIVGQELRRRGATADDPAIVALGISVDEIERARPGNDPRSPLQYRTYPLLDMGLSRDDCKSIISDAGLPVPPKSACWFCPFNDRQRWRDLRDKTPDLFQLACDLEATLGDRAESLGRNRVWLTSRGKPLASVMQDDAAKQGSSSGMDACDSGYCMT